MQIKKNLEDLSVFGGKPVFSEAIHVGRPITGNREKLLHRINDLLDRRWLTNNGPFVQEFEKQVAQMLNVKHAIAMCNGTVGLEIAVRALGLSGEVIIPAFTFIATAHALQWQEITPVFCDINSTTQNIDPEKIASLITPRTTGIIGVHLWGRPCCNERLQEIAEKHNLKLLFDSAHALGCSYRGKMIGGFGNAEVFSFHATKFFNTFEGGMVTTNDDLLAHKIRLMKNFGFSGYDNVIHIGTNGKMSEIAAAMGLTQFENFGEIIAHNYKNYSAYREEIYSLKGVKMIEYNESEKCNYQYIVIEIDEDLTSISRDNIIHCLHAENILARRYFYPGCHRMQPYRSYFPHTDLLLSETNRMAKRIIVLPTGETLAENDIVAIGKILKFIIENGKRISDKLLNFLDYEIETPREL